LTEEFIGRVNATKPEGVHLPEKNNFFPTDLDVLDANESESSAVKCIAKSISSIVWYAKDDQFKNPKLEVSANYYTTDAGWGKKPEQKVFLELWSKVIDEYLREFNY
jgi:secreted Zn-dependent insulinase-like peptidase